MTNVEQYRLLHKTVEQCYDNIEKLNAMARRMEDQLEELQDNKSHLHGLLTEEELKEFEPF